MKSTTTSDVKYAYLRGYDGGPTIILGYPDTPEGKAQAKAYSKAYREGVADRQKGIVPKYQTA